MKRTVLAGFVVFGLSVLIAGMGPVFAGGGIDPQEVWTTWQSEAALETGALPGAEVGKPEMGAISTMAPGVSSDLPDFDKDPRWKESGGE